MYLPEEERWYNFYDYKEITEKGNLKEYKITDNSIGLFIKGGGIIPVKHRLRRSTKLIRFESITLIVALNNEDSAQGILYFDDEESNDYEDKKNFFMKKIHFQKNELFIAHISDDFKISNKIEKIIITGLKKNILSIKFTNFAESIEEDLEYVQKGDITCIKRAKISMEYLWKIKFNYEEEN